MAPEGSGPCGFRVRGALSHHRVQREDIIGAAITDLDPPDRATLIAQDSAPSTQLVGARRDLGHRLLGPAFARVGARVG